MHQTFVIDGGAELSGEIEVKGAKNAALKIIAAALLSDEPCTITNLPNIEDVRRMCELVQSLGVIVTTAADGSTTIDPRNLENKQLDRKLVETVRTSILLAAPLLARFGEVKIAHPGGDKIGQRPIDIFLDGFAALGAKTEIQDDSYHLSAKHLRGSAIFMRRISHTATEAMIMASVLAEGTTVIKNAAMEPEVVALANYLNSVGAKIAGAGTSTITIQGVEKIGGGTYTLIPDRLEAATFITLGLLTNSQLTITNCEPQHLESLLWHLERTGAQLTVDGTTITTHRHKGLHGYDVIAHEYPGFATDFQPCYTVLMTQFTGPTIVHDPIYQGGRLFYTDLLNSMGANIIMCDPYRVVVNGPTKLRGRYLTSPDIRAGMALVLAGLVAEGQTVIDNVYQIERGYERIVERLAGIGARIQRTEK